MKLKTTFTLMAMTMIALSSCNKDDEKLRFNELDPEANKQLVENSAISAAKAVSELKDEVPIDASVNFATYLDMANPLDAQPTKKSKIISTIEMIAGLGTDKTSFSDVFATMASPEELTDDPETLQEAWDMVVGTYTWNASMEDWDYTSNNDAIVFKFPSTENGTTNNAIFTVSEYSSVTITNDILSDEGEYNGDLPASLNIDFEIDGSSVMSMTYAAEYNDDAYPSSVAADLTIGTFKFSVDATNNDKEVSAKHSFTQDGDIILEASGSVNGDFTQENIDANMVTQTRTYTDWTWNDDTQMYEDYVDTWEELDIGGVFQTGSFKLQLYNISIGGGGDITAMANAEKEIYPDNYEENQNFDDAAATEAMAAAMNEHMKMYAIDEDARKKIADVEAYVVMENDYDYIDYWIDFRLVYGDGSLVDMETYFESGFEDFVKELNYIIVDLNSDYDGLDLDLIDY